MSDFLTIRAVFKLCFQIVCILDRTKAIKCWERKEKTSCKITDTDAVLQVKLHFLKNYVIWHDFYCLLTFLLAFLGVSKENFLVLVWHSQYSKLGAA